MRSIECTRKESSIGTSSRPTSCSRPTVCRRSPTSAWPRTLASREGQTRSGTILGSPATWPPEQAGGNAHRVGPAADVYALGAILFYELLAACPTVPRGRRPLWRPSASSSPTTPAAARGSPPEGATRPGDDLPQVPGEVPPQSVWFAARAGRGSRAIPRPRADPRPAWSRPPSRRVEVVLAKVRWPALGLAAAVIPATIGLSIFLAIYHYHSLQKIKAARPPRSRPVHARSIRPRHITSTATASTSASRATSAKASSACPRNA